MKNNFTKIALVDGESVRNINPLALSEYESVYYFFGALQKGFEFDVKQEERALLQPINITIIPIAKTGKNNLDFHLASYVGRLNLEIDKDVRLHVYSRDSGYDELLKFYTKQGRICKRFETYVQSQNKPTPTKTAKETKPQQKYKPNSNIKSICKELNALPIIKRPKKMETLKNFIKAHKIGKEQQFDDYIKILREHHGLKMKDEKLDYSKFKCTEK